MDYVKWLFFVVAKVGKGRISHYVEVFWNKQKFMCGFHVAVGLFSNRSQKMSKCFFFYSYHILMSSVIYYWTDARQHGIYLLNRSMALCTCFHSECFFCGHYNIKSWIFLAFWLVLQGFNLKKFTEAMSVVNLSSWKFRLFMMTSFKNVTGIKQKNEWRNCLTYQGCCLRKFLWSPLGS